MPELSAETKAKILAIKYNLPFYLYRGYKGWNRRFQNGDSDAANPSVIQLWQALEQADNNLVRAYEQVEVFKEGG